MWICVHVWIEQFILNPKIITALRYTVMENIISSKENYLFHSFVKDLSELLIINCCSVIFDTHTFIARYICTTDIDESLHLTFFNIRQ